MTELYHEDYYDNSIDEIALNKSASYLPYTGLQGLAALEVCLAYDDILYILRSLFQIVTSAADNNLDQASLVKEIRRFEDDSLLPACFSSMPFSKMLKEIENSQYLYPLFDPEREVTLPRFYKLTASQ